MDGTCCDELTREEKGSTVESGVFGPSVGTVENATSEYSMASTTRGKECGRL
ncbi:hypothetical protein Syun_027550 [Stephania yunnanensis]|uniref:Uncharacterized protein n=1 Tax=Stephania yunnanensis TaxID=152371 RepID=A0AAP0HMX0_9MAGN